MARQHVSSWLAERRTLISCLWLHPFPRWLFGSERVPGRNGVNVGQEISFPEELNGFSSTPIAGGQYHWTAQFAPKRFAASVSWIQGKNPGV